MLDHLSVDQTSGGEPTSKKLKVTLDYSQDSSVGSALDWYHEGLGHYHLIVITSK